MLGVIKSFAHRDAGPGAKLKDQWNPGIDVPAVRGRADSGDIEIDLVELFTDLGGLAADVGKGIAIFIDEMQDLGPDDVSALCAACHEISQTGLPVIVVGAGLPHLPAVLSASKSYSERLFRYQRIDRLARDAADLALTAPASRGGRRVHRGRAGRDVCRDRRLPLLHPGLRQGRLGPRPALADHRRRRARSRRPEAESELAVGFFGSRYERATPGERDYLRAMADVAAASDEPEGDAVLTADVAATLGQEAAVALAGARRPAQEGPHLLRRARPDRLHGAALRALPARARGLTGRVNPVALDPAPVRGLSAVAPPSAQPAHRPQSERGGEGEQILGRSLENSSIHTHCGGGLGTQRSRGE